MEQPIDDSGDNLTSMALDNGVAAELADEAAAGVPDGGGGVGEKDDEGSAGFSGPLDVTVAAVGDGETVEATKATAAGDGQTVAASAGASAAADLQGEEDGEQVGGDNGSMEADSAAAALGGGGGKVEEEVGKVNGGVEKLDGEDGAGASGSLEGKEESQGQPTEGMWKGDMVERGKKEAKKAEAAQDREVHGLEEEGRKSQGDGGSHGKDLEEGKGNVSEACVNVEGIGEGGVGRDSLKEELQEAAVVASREGDRGEAEGDKGGAEGDKGGAEGNVLVEAGGGGEGQLVNVGKPAAEGASETSDLAANTLAVAADAAAAAVAAATVAAEEAATADKVAAVPASVDDGAAATAEANAAQGSAAPDVAAPSAAPHAAAAAPLQTKPTDGPEADGEGEAPKGEKRKRERDGDGEEVGAKKEKMSGEGGGRAVKDAVNLKAEEEELKGLEHGETHKAEEEDGDTYPEEGDEEHEEEALGTGMQGKVEGASDAAGGYEKVEGQKGKAAGKEGAKPPPPGSTALTTKDVRKMMGSPVLTKPNAVAHTMRKLIVFASLAIRQGLDDLLRLEFRHFRVLHRGEPYLSPASPGEHVLFDPPSSLAPDLVQKQFFPNPHNRYLCPVRLLDEESAMRPHNAPPALFLTVKYARAPSYEPLNRYVRNAMGRSTLGRFASLLGETAGLRSVGRRFFRALGVTIMFMAGFSTDEVLREARCSTSVLHALFRPDAAEAAAAAEQDRQHRQQQQQQKKGQVMAARGHKHHHHHDGKGGGEGLSFGLPSFGNMGDGGSGGGGDPLQSQLKTAQLLQQLQATQLMSAQLQAQLLASQLQTQQLQSALQQGGATPAVVGGIAAAGSSGAEGGEGGSGGGVGGVGMGTNTSTGTMGTSMGGMNTSTGAMAMTPMQSQQGMGSSPSMPMVTPPPVLPAPGSNFSSSSAMPSPSSGSGMGGPMTQSGMYQIGPGGVGQSSNTFGTNPGMGDSGSLLQPMQQQQQQHQLYNSASQQQLVQYGAGMPSTGGGGGGASSYTAQLQGTYSSSIGSGMNGRIA